MDTPGSLHALGGETHRAEGGIGDTDDQGCGVRPRGGAQGGLREPGEEVVRKGLATSCSQTTLHALHLHPRLTAKRSMGLWRLSAPETSWQSPNLMGVVCYMFRL